MLHGFLPVRVIGVEVKIVFAAITNCLHGYPA